MKVTIIICTYNRQEKLNTVLSNLVEQATNQWMTEVLVVNNNSVDQTSAVIKSYRQKLHIREINESNQGLAYARNTGIRQARGDTLVFVDDDMRLHEKWFSACVDAFQQHPESLFFGGRIIPYWPDGKPQWVKDEKMPLLSGVFGTFDLGDDTRAFTAAEPGPMGGSFAIRKPLIEQIGYFNQSLGRSGDELGRGEETEFFERAKNSGATGVYIAESICFHYVDAARLKFISLWKYGVQSSIAHSQIHGSEASGYWIFGVLENLVRGLYQQLTGRGDNFRQCIIRSGMAYGMAKTNQKPKT